MLCAQSGQLIERAADLGQGVTHRQRQKVLGFLIARTGIQRHAPQPGAGNTADVHGFGAEVAQALMKVLNMHGARMLPLARLRGYVSKSTGINSSKSP